MRACEVVEVWHYFFSTSALDGSLLLFHGTTALTPVEESAVNFDWEVNEHGRSSENSYKEKAQFIRTLL